MYINYIDQFIVFILMRKLSLFKIIVFYLAMGAAIIFVSNSFIVLSFLKMADKTGLKFNLIKEFLFLITAAVFTYFSIRFYKKNYEDTRLNYQKIFINCPLPMYIMDRGNYKILAVNEAMCRLYGYSEQEFIRMDTFDIRPPDEHKRMLEYLERCTGGETESGIWKHLKKNGDVFYVNVNFHTIPLLKENAYLVMITDIDKSLSDERRINDLLHLYETVNKATHDVIWDYDLLADRLNWMQGYHEIYGYKDNVGLTNFWEMPKVHGDDRPLIVAAFRKILAEKQKEWFMEYKYFCADGGVKYVRDRGYMIFDEAGEPVRMIGALQDIDKQKNYEQQLLSQNDQLKEIAWLNSHQVRRPLSNIMGLISLIKEPSNAQEEILQFVDLLAVSAKELDNAVILINRQTMEGTEIEVEKDVV